MNYVYGYQKCSTVSKARKYLEKQGVDFVFFDFVAEQIARETLEKLIAQSTYDIDDFFNKKGVLFKELNLKTQLADLSDSAKIDLLLSDGKLLKRPIIQVNDKIILGFKESTVSEIIK
jgi:arsenate reductase (glutaredoxin)